MRKALVLLLTPLLTTGCERGFTSRDEAAIRNVMSDQETAWDRGDIDGFMTSYSDSVCFIGRGKRTCGKEQVTANYKKHYPSAAAMGDLHFGDLEVLGAGPDHAWCTGTWSLRRETDTLAGGFSLFWSRERAGWRILRDHTY